MKYLALFLALIIAAAPVSAVAQQRGGGRPAGGGGARPAGGGGARPGGGGGFNFNRDTAPAASRPNTPVQRPAGNANAGSNRHQFNTNTPQQNRNQNRPNNINTGGNRTNINTGGNTANINRGGNTANVNRGNHTYYNSSGNRVTCNNCTFVRNPVYGGGAAWGWHGGAPWYPAGAYWGGGFWGAFAIGVTSAAVYGAIVANNTRYVSYQIQPNSPGATMLANYQLTQTQCGPPNLVVVFGPNNSVICAYPNNMVSPGNYNLDTSTLSLVSQ